MKSKPPLLLHLLAVLFLLASLVCLFGVIQTISSWNWLIAADYQPHPGYNVFENTFLFLAFLGAALLLWMRWVWAPLFARQPPCWRLPGSGWTALFWRRLALLLPDNSFQFWFPFLFWFFCCYLYCYSNLS